MYNNLFEKFESEVMDYILNEEPKVSEALNRQYKSAKVISREFTRVGFFTDYEIEDTSLKIPAEFSQPTGRLQVSFPGLVYGAGFILFFKDGLISMLEGYTNAGELWPEDITGYIFHPNGVQ